MAVLVFSELKSLAYDRAQVNVTIDPPVSDAEFARFVNEAYADVWNVSGGRIKRVASATAWTSAQTATGVVAGILTDVEEVLHVWASTTSGSIGQSTGDNELDKVELSYIHFMRSREADGTYNRPKIYAVSRMATTTVADVNKLQLDYWPNVTGFYLPTNYTPQFSPIDSATVTTPDVNDLESRDIALLTAAKIAPLNGRAELVPSILGDVSMRTAEILGRKLSALMDSRQDE